MIANRYSLDREIGRGGMGAVWLGRDEVLGRAVALKRVGVPPGGVDPDIERAEREAKMAARLSHPNVVSVYDLAQDGDLQWLVMEYVEGTNLAELIRSNGALPPDQAAPLLAQTADALVAAHAAGVVHRDVKPSNILVTPEGTVKLSDFGIARTAGDASLTQTGLVTGSPAYLSPEVASGRSATSASDIWSLGATAFHAIEGHPPYEVGDNLLGALYRIVHEEPPLPSAPGWLAPLFAATMNRDEDQRWDAAQIRDFLTAGPSATVLPVPTAVRSRRGPKPQVTPADAAPAHRTQVLRGVDTQESPRIPAQEPRSRSRLWLAAVAALVGAILVAAILVVTLGGEDKPGVEQTAPTPSVSASASTPPGPTEEGMTNFIRGYLTQVTSNRTMTFSMLTTEFQDESGGFEKYDEFWSQVKDIEVVSLQADPETLVATYDYTYRRGNTPEDDTVSLNLTYRDGKYLIAGES